MKNIPIPYGKTTLSLTCEDHELRGVVSCGKVENAGADQTGLVLEALANPIGSRPLHALAAEASTVLLITSDHTRPVPSHITVPAMLAEIRRCNPQAEIRSEGRKRSVLMNDRCNLQEFHQRTSPLALVPI